MQNTKAKGKEGERRNAHNGPLAHLERGMMLMMMMARARRREEEEGSPWGGVRVRLRHDMMLTKVFLTCFLMCVFSSIEIL